MTGAKSSPACVWISDNNESISESSALLTAIAKTRSYSPMVISSCPDTGTPSLMARQSSGEGGSNRRPRLGEDDGTFVVGATVDSSSSSPGTIDTSSSSPPARSLRSGSDELSVVGLVASSEEENWNPLVPK